METANINLIIILMTDEKEEEEEFRLFLCPARRRALRHRFMPNFRFQPVLVRSTIGYWQYTAGLRQTDISYEQFKWLLLKTYLFGR